MSHLKLFSKKIILLHAALFPLAARAQLGRQITGELGDAGRESGLISTQDFTLPEIIGRIINVALTLLGIIFLVLIVYAGFKWMLARGREEEVERAQKIIESSIIGLIVIILAFAISKFVFATILGGADIR
ncbi:MAG: pilin [Patescibacteria group bacterium]